MNFYQHSPQQINQLADALEDPELANMRGLGWKAAFHLRELQGRIAELEAMLDAVGAGGVGQSIKPQIQADTSPAAWAIYSDDGTAIRLWSKDKATAQEAADKHGRPLVPLYTAPQPTRQPLTDSQVKELVKKRPAEDLCRWSYGMGIKDAEAAHGITESQP